MQTDWGILDQLAGTTGLTTGKLVEILDAINELDEKRYASETETDATYYQGKISGSIDVLLLAGANFDDIRSALAERREREST